MVRRFLRQDLQQGCALICVAERLRIKALPDKGQVTEGQQKEDCVMQSTKIARKCMPTSTIFELCFVLTARVACKGRIQVSDIFDAPLRESHVTSAAQ